MTEQCSVINILRKYFVPTVYIAFPDLFDNISAMPNQPFASSFVIVLMALDMASCKLSFLRAFAFFKNCLNFDQYNSIGDKSGEYGGR